MRRVYAGIAVVVVGVAALASRAGAVFPVDDAYIALHAADVLFGGTDPDFPGATALTGATCAPHVVLTALLALAAPTPWALWGVGWLATAAYLLGVARLAEVVGARPPHALALAALAATAGVTPHQLTNGLETGLALAGVAWTLVFLAAPDRGPWWAAPALCGTLPYLRPELGLLAALVLAARARQRHDWRRDLAVAAAAAAPWALLYLATTGLPWPNTIGAKRAFFAEACGPFPRRLRWTRVALTGFALPLVETVAAVGLLPFVRHGWLLLAFVAGFVLAYLQLFPGALGHYEHRYVYVLVPLLLYALAQGMVDPRRAVRWPASGLLALALVHGAITVPDNLVLMGQLRANTEGTLGSASAWIREELPPDARLLVHDAGYVAWATEQPKIDLVGLKTPLSAAVHARVTLPSCGRDRADAVDAIARDTRPDYLVVLDGWDRVYRLTGGLRAHGWDLRPVRDVPGYRVFALTPPADAPR